MSLAANMKLLGEDMISSQKARIKNLKELKKEVRELLTDFREELKELKKEVRELLTDFREERAAARAIWLHTLEILAKIRMGKIDP
ncbi:MAG: hypothetical protein AB1523_05915 [Bacillota bacterium]